MTIFYLTKCFVLWWWWLTLKCSSKSTVEQESSCKIFSYGILSPFWPIVGIPPLLCRHIHILTWYPIECIMCQSMPVHMSSSSFASWRSFESTQAQKLDETATKGSTPSSSEAPLEASNIYMVVVYSLDWDTLWVHLVKSVNKRLWVNLLLRKWNIGRTYKIHTL